VEAIRRKRDSGERNPFSLLIPSISLEFINGNQFNFDFFLPPVYSPVDSTLSRTTQSVPEFPAALEKTCLGVGLYLGWALSLGHFHPTFLCISIYNRILRIKHGLVRVLAFDRFCYFGVNGDVLQEFAKFKAVVWCANTENFGVL